LPAFLFQHLQQQAQLGHFHRLGIDIHPIDIIDQDALFLGGGQFPAPTFRRDQGRLLAFGPFFRVMRQVPGFMPIQQILEGTQQEGSGSTSRVDDLERADRIRRLAFHQFPDRVGDDVIDNISGCVIHPAGFAHLGFFFNFHLVAGRQADDLTQELLIDLPEDLDRDFLEDVGAGEVQAFDDLLQHLVVDHQPGREAVGVVALAFFGFEVEQPRVVFDICPLKELDHLAVNFFALAHLQQLVLRLNAAIFADA